MIESNLFYSSSSKSKSFHGYIVSSHRHILINIVYIVNYQVADQETVKISDFGLARVATNDFYQMHSNSNIPVRWEAIECLTHRKYSHKSDVWSFGVTLWEMFAFGAIPALDGCQDFFTSYQRQRQDFKVRYC